jgi:large subunit ribosomal protein L17
MFRNMITSLVLHGTIKTTEPRAKELRRFAERVITTAKRAPRIEGLEGEALRAAKAKRVHHIRLAKRWVNDDEALKKLFGELAERYATRPGGYTRIVKTGKRGGDNAPMAYVALVEAAPNDGLRDATAEPAPVETPTAE